jgi:hypothetical protein
MPQFYYQAYVDPPRRVSERRAGALLRIKQLWIYTVLIVVIIGGMISALAQEWRLLVPIGGLSILVAFVGTVLTLLQERLERNQSKGEHSWGPAQAGAQPGPDQYQSWGR